jgi:hypothetical protein
MRERSRIRLTERRNSLPRIRARDGAPYPYPR